MFLSDNSGCLKMLRIIAALCLSLAAFMVLSGSYMFLDTPSFKIKYEGDLPEDPDFLDMLLPIGGDDEWYTDRNEDTADLIPENSEISAYCEDGLKSMAVHLRGSAVRNRNNMFYIWLPDDCLNGGTPNAAYNKFCMKYKNFRIAAVDSDGNIIYISEEKPLTRAIVHPIHPEITYYAETGTVETHFIPSGDVTALMSWMCFFTPLTLVGAGILAVVFKIRLDKKGTVTLRHIIEAGLLNIPWIMSSLVIFWHARIHTVMFPNQAVFHLSQPTVSDNEVNINTVIIGNIDNLNHHSSDTMFFFHCQAVPFR